LKWPFHITFPGVQLPTLVSMEQWASGLEKNDLSVVAVFHMNKVDILMQF